MEIKTMLSSNAKSVLTVTALLVLMAIPFAGRTAGGQDPAKGKAALLPAGSRLTELPLTAVRIQDTFWSPRLEVNRTRTLDHVYKELEATECIRNFDIASG